MSHEVKESIFSVCIVNEMVLAHQIFCRIVFILLLKNK